MYAPLNFMVMIILCKESVRYRNNFKDICENSVLLYYYVQDSRKISQKQFLEIDILIYIYINKYESTVICNNYIL